MINSVVGRKHIVSKAGKECTVLCINYEREGYEGYCTIEAFAPKGYEDVPLGSSIDGLCVGYDRAKDRSFIYVK